jgi:hypothetical protein
MRPLACALIVCLWSGAALAAPPASPTDVSPLTVFPKTEAPKVTATFPAAGQGIPAGVLVLSVTFDQKMLGSRFAFAPAAGGEMPDCLTTPRLLADQKTFVLLCSTLPHKAYALSFNAAPSGGFANVAEHRAEPATLAFATNEGGGPRTIPDAMKAANLGDIDMPIETDPNDGKAAP